jgi:hypothetical protein
MNQSEIEKLQQLSKEKQQEMIKEFRKELLGTRKRKVDSRQVIQEMKEAVQMMDLEIKKSESGLQELDSSGGVLKITNTQYQTINGLLGTGRQVLKRLESKDKTDRMLLYIGVGIFLSTVLYIIIKRL